MAVTILLADDCAVTRSTLRRLIELESNFEVVGEAENGLTAVEKAVKLQPDLVIMDINMPVMNGMEATEKISLECPKTSVVMCSVQGERDYLRKAMNCGAKDYLVKPISTDQLLDTVNNIYSLEKKRQSKVMQGYLEDNFVERSQVFTLVSAKGGVGKTTIATNLAATAARLGKSVCVLDLDLQFGDMAMFFSLSGTRHNICSLIQEGGEFDSDTISKYLLTHDSGAKMLAAPLRPEQGEYISVDHVREILATLQQMFQLVIVDTAPTPNDLFFSVLEASDTIGLVSTPSLPVLKNNFNLLQLLIHLGVEPEKIQVLLNRSYSKTGVRESDVEDILQREVYWELPNDFAMVDASVNEGLPFAWSQPEHRLSKQMESLLFRLLGAENRRMSARMKKGLWKLFG